MNYDEEYWRAKAVEAQRVAEQYYAHAMTARTNGTSAARAWQAEAYDAHQKAMARLGWAEVERNNTRGKWQRIAALGLRA